MRLLSKLEIRDIKKDIYKDPIKKPFVKNVNNMVGMLFS